MIARSGQEAVLADSGWGGANGKGPCLAEAGAAGAMVLPLVTLRLRLRDWSAGQGEMAVSLGQELSGRLGRAGAMCHPGGLVATWPQPASPTELLS